jgi:Phage integrase SAM-like domain
MKVTFRTSAHTQPQAPAMPPVPQSPQRTLADLFAHYLAASAPGQAASTQYQYQIFYDKILRDFGSRTLGEVTAELLRDWKLHLSQRHKLATVHRYLARMSCALAFAVESGWLPSNPLAAVRKPSPGKGCTRFLTTDERARLLIACRASPNPMLYPIVVLALTTGDARMRSVCCNGPRWTSTLGWCASSQRRRRRPGPCPCWGKRVRSWRTWHATAIPASPGSFPRGRGRSRLRSRAPGRRHGNMRTWRTSIFMTYAIRSPPIWPCQEPRYGRLPRCSDT